MIYNNLKIAFRSLWRKKSFSLLNILGLAIGVAASLLIFSVIRNELSFDAYHKKADRTYRITTTIINRSNGEVNGRNAGVTMPLPDVLRRDFPQIEKVACYWFFGNAQVYIPGKQGEEEKRFKSIKGTAWADPGVFEMFDFTWLEGNAKELEQPNTVVIAESVADNYFGGYQQAIGRTVEMYSFRLPLRITGVFKDLPGNTDMPFLICPSFATLKKVQPDFFTNWAALNDNLSCFVLLKEGVTPAALSSQFPALVKKYYGEDQRGTSAYSRLGMQPMRTVHLDAEFVSPVHNAFSRRELWSMGLIGIFLLLVACINFINLATAQSVSRAKEIGVRKVLGSGRLQLLRQFLNETGVITFFALLLSIIIAKAAMPSMCQLIERNITLWHPVTGIYLLCTGIAVTMLAGFYPAVMLSGFNPVAAIKSRISSRSVGGVSLRRGLVVLQFVIAQLLVIGTVVVVQQMKYFREKPMGFDKGSTVMINLPSDPSLLPKYDLLKTRLKAIPGVENASICVEGPSARWNVWESELYFNGEKEKRSFLTSHQVGDSDYLNTFGITLKAGRLPFASDTIRELLVNEMMVKKLGLPNAEAIIGTTITFFKDGRGIPVVGVVHDYNTKSLREEIMPAVLHAGREAYENIALRIPPSKMKTVIPEAQRIFTEVYPTYMFDLAYLDERIESYYRSEEITGQLFQVFAVLAIFISCLGLYGLVSFMAVQKTKEVGVRKVLGASVKSIVYLFSKEFTLLVGLAFLIAAPVGYYFMKAWLSDFHYHINLGVGVFVLAIVLSIGVAWLTVGYTAVKAALTNPVKSLRAE